MEIEVDEKCYKPEKLIENEQVKISWNFSIQTNRVLDAPKPDTTVIDQIKK